MEENSTNEEKKFCSGCKTFKTLDNFNKDKRSPDGLYYLCKDCSRERVKKSMEKKKQKKLQDKIAEIRQENEKKNMLLDLTSRQLMDELLKRGYEGTLKKTIELTLVNGTIVNKDKYKM